MSETEENVVMGVIIGMFLMACLWFASAAAIEKDKVNAGYLTYQKKIYKVELYSEPNYPNENQ